MLELGRLTTGCGIALLFGAAWTLPAFAAEQNLPMDEIEIGRRIYQEGLLPSGAPLIGLRKDSQAVSGAAAACVNCHRRSGMGSVEGNIEVPPITGNALYNFGDQVIATMDPRSGKRWNLKHDPYTDDTLAIAIRLGINNGEREMNFAMPRYQLEAREVNALTAYLKQLSRKWSPGITAETIHFATIVTPEVAPERKQIFLDMMRAAFAQKNGSTVTGSNAGGRRHMVSPAEMILGTERNWQLDVWELTGAPETWTAQLDALYRSQPVFAVVSGLSNNTWEPVHRFCENERIPCWFPSVDLAPIAERDFYTVYFSGGVVLEAKVLARYLSSEKRLHPGRLVQVYPDDAVGRGAAQALAQALQGSGIKLENRVLKEDSADALRAAVAEIRTGDTVMYWLRPADLRLLDKLSSPARTAYFSARLAGSLLNSFPPNLKGNAHLVYPYELPQLRETNLAYFHQWLKLRNLPLVDEPLQSEIFFSLNYLSDTMAEMLDNLYRDYLLERGESMLGKRENSKAEGETWSRNNLRQAALDALALNKSGEPATAANKGEGTTIYPRLSLGQMQRFASKGAYIVHFDNPRSEQLIAESGWIIP